ncbi:hypothetical protein KSF78_0005064 [Schistosoma japonicum]|nr:hypothetical protein KSF78_0005064 [Schistosoma japonicum]
MPNILIQRSHATKEIHVHIPPKKHSNYIDEQEEWICDISLHLWGSTAKTLKLTAFYKIFVIIAKRLKDA